MMQPLADRLWLLAVIALTLESACSPPSPTDQRCPSPILWRDAGQHVGELVYVRGPVQQTLYAAQSDGRPTLLDLGSGTFDPSRFTVTIWGRARPNFTLPPEEMYSHRAICVRGVIEEDMGSLGLEVSQSADIVIE